MITDTAERYEGLKGVHWSGSLLLHPPSTSGEHTATFVGANPGHAHGSAGGFCTASPLLSCG